MAKVELARVRKVYRGRADRCCCGCSGEWSYPEGYGGDEGPVDQRMVERVVRKINRTMADPALPSGHAWGNDDHVAVRSGNSWYIAYYSE